MKKQKPIILVLLATGMFLFACKKYEPVPVDRVTIDFIFDKNDSAGTKAEAFLLGVYRVMKFGHGRISDSYLDAASDDAVTSTAESNDLTILSTGSYSSNSMPGSEDVWDDFYIGIRRANIFINNIDAVPTNLKESNNLLRKYNWKSEARFLRAYFYFELLKRYGGIPILGDKVYQLDDDVALPRNNFEDCVNYIVSECDAIKDSILVERKDQDSHRATKRAVLALKSKVLLYAASPLYNEGVTNPLLGYVGGDVKERWVRARNAAAEALLVNRTLLPDFRNVFLTPNNEEVIFVRAIESSDNSGNSDNIEEAQAPINFPAPVSRGATSPTQEFVDAFTMRNGLAISDPQSGYNDNNPYFNRDPRLDYTVFYNGSTWVGTNTATNKVETFEGGRSKPNGTQIQTRTSYYMRKFMGKWEGAEKFDNHWSDWVVFRNAELYLNFAEASNEIDGPNAPLLKQDLRELRKRAGIAENTAGVAGTYGIRDNISQTEMRDLIRNERRTELAFEEQRFFDIRRWKIAETVMNQPRQGLSIIKLGETSYEYNRVNVLQTKFEAAQNKMYFYPIPYVEVLKNPNMKQNPGW
ncbi:RagB/SusD family nutrient uptake outer membrane protein [Mucilaginibacter limnophilus]|uniref:RagB/SusD family nutrient uptake outer membrane protein n=1 Tax=Mucilaginibacter limnophilus TaxID=1932778 RepID=A0A437MY59_9SPHI|nr:RagB/SusD family nutrient uptake outer membrane protein [Mucilaginibacter limnophilus]RVU02610.1 RagB/SusD family nutrient uptake outer membrane protein [Mucilaginibacter limnophilus]